MFGVELAGLFEDPTFSVGMICRFVGSTMDLAQSVQDFVQAGWFLFTTLKWLFSLTGSRAPESDVDRCVVRALFLVLTFVFIMSWLPIAIPYFGCAWVAGAFTGQPAIFTRAKVGHKDC